MRLIPVFLLLLALPSFLNAQRQPSPIEYMNTIGDKYAELSVKYYQYLSAVAHAASTRRVDKKREQLLKTSWKTYTEVRTLPTFQGNRSLRDTAAYFLYINHRVLKEDFDKILNMERIAEQSYDAMEAYLMAQKEARNKLDVANIRMLVEQRKFASAYGLELVVRDDEVYSKMQKTNESLNYLNKIYLAFFKCHKQEIYLLDALTRKDREGIEKNRGYLEDYIASAREVLNTLPTYENDRSLAMACQRIVDFYERETVFDTPAMLAYMQSEEAFSAARAVYEGLSSDERTKENVAIYNDAVRTMNAAADRFNALNQNSNAERTRLLQAWREAYDTFLDRHIPLF